MDANFWNGFLDVLPMMIGVSICFAFLFVFSISRIEESSNESNWIDYERAYEVWKRNGAEGEPPKPEDFGYLIKY